MKQATLALIACLALFAAGSSQAQTQGSPAPPPIKETNDASFGRDVVEPSSNTTVVVFFRSSWCGPCQRIWPQFVNAAERGNITLVSVDIEKLAYDLMRRHGVRAVPVIVAYRDGKPIKTLQGAPPATQVSEFLEALPSPDPHVKRPPLAPARAR